MQSQPLYLAYMLRLWQTPSGEELVWRASVESPHTGERHFFANLDQLHAMLDEKCSRTEASAPAAGAQAIEADSEKRWKLIKAQVVVRAWEDEEFCQALLKDPQSAIRAAGLDLPDGLEIQVLLEEPDEARRYIILPHRPAVLPQDRDEISIQELAALAGGTSPNYNLHTPDPDESGDA